MVKWYQSFRSNMNKIVFAASHKLFREYRAFSHPKPRYFLDAGAFIGSRPETTELIFLGLWWINTRWSEPKTRTEIKQRLHANGFIQNIEDVDIEESYKLMQALRSNQND